MSAKLTLNERWPLNHLKKDLTPPGAPGALKIAPRVLGTLGAPGDAKIIPRDPRDHLEQI